MLCRKYSRYLHSLSTYPGQSPQPISFIPGYLYLQLPSLLFLWSCTYTLSPVPIYSPLCLTAWVSFTYSLYLPTPIASYGYTTTFLLYSIELHSYLVSYCNRLQRCSSNSLISLLSLYWASSYLELQRCTSNLPITERHVQAAVGVVLILKGN